MSRLHMFSGTVVDLEKVSAVSQIKSNSNFHRYKVLLDGTMMTVKLDIHSHKSTATRQLHLFMAERIGLIKAWAAYHAYDVVKILEKEWLNAEEDASEPCDAGEKPGKARTALSPGSTVIA